MVAKERVELDDDLSPNLPTEMEAGSVPRRVYIRRDVEMRKYDFAQRMLGW